MLDCGLVFMKALLSLFRKCKAAWSIVTLFLQLLPCLPGLESAHLHELA